MGHGRARPKRLAAKLFEIRQARGWSQSQMVHALNFKTTAARVHEFENGKREPNLLVLLAYARAAHAPVEFLIDDDLELDDAYD